MSSKISESHNAFGLTEIISVCGFALFFAWHLITALWLSPSYAATLSQPLQMASQAVFLLGAAAATIFISIRKIFRKLAVFFPKKTLTITFLILGCLPAIFCFLDIDRSFGYAVFNTLLFLSGLSTVYFFAIWEDIEFKIGITSPVKLIALSFCGGIVLFIVGRFAFEGQCPAVTIICLACATFLYLLVRRDLSIDSAEELTMEEDEDTLPARKTVTISRHFIGIGVFFLPLGMSFGFALGILSTTADFWLLALSFAVGLLISLTVLASLKWTERLISLEVLETVCAGSIATAFVIAIAGQNQTTLLIGLCIIAVTWLVFRSLNGGLLVRYATKNGLSSASTLATGKIGVNLGIAIGLLLACLLGYSSMSEKIFSLIAAILAILVIILGFLHFSIASIQNTEALLKPQSYSLQAFMTKCMKVADLYQLSPREAEILCYLARGRNAKHIAEELFISEHTAKSHIYRIYRKMDVHSRQGLLDCIETSYPDSESDD